MSDSVPEAHVPPRRAEPGPRVSAEAPDSGVPAGSGPGPAEGVPGPGDEPAAPAPLGVPRTPTGDAEVDAHLERLADADHLATDGHVEVYEDVHRGLRDALTALDARPGPPAPPRS
ncbi:hypothetical protein [Streptomyces poonensis]|uniref:Uncharacterized protein n=1 Tax=Streptomyces poonensis TaxID=68255 RepID=A0A918PGF2_9ACTN|nr:hypothetical protein [Streptomyces poonensis]GGZ06350.1 hypothetical protein GCM10010365_26610 [Streptomyces poonensis]GLJ93906.1 hypothetical protein GCM10017589_65240 [Streptomyces poonensis]